MNNLFEQIRSDCPKSLIVVRLFNMQGQVYKIHSDFYYVNTENGIYECKLREVLKKQKLEIFVGDQVILDQINDLSKQAFILKMLPRENYISKPRAANVSQAIIVSSIKNPELDFEQLNRYIAHCEYHNVEPILCFNKCDLDIENRISDEINSIYNPLDYKIHFTSALKKIGIKELEKKLENKVSIFCGASGVGKSSIINTLSSGLKLKTKDVSTKSKRGVHTTRHCEIIKIKEKTAVVDTPGFSNLKFNFLLPSSIQDLFPEIKNYSKYCRFNDCLHTTESGCNVKENLDKINPSRYESYVKFVTEAIEYKTKITYSGTKTESKTKINKNTVMTKISSKKRNTSRKTNKQVINKTIEEAKNG